MARQQHKKQHALKMPRLATRLTELQIRNATPRQKPYRLGDGRGLYLQVDPSGKRFWRMKYDRGNKETTISIGSYPAISLSAARAERDKTRTLLAKGRNPVEERSDCAQQIRASKAASITQFRLSLSSDGALVVDKPAARIRLNAAQVAA